MRQLNLPRKYTASAQLWISLALIILAAIFAFTPIITLNMSDDSFAQQLDDFLDNIESNEIKDSDDFDIPNEIDVTAPKIITSINVFTKVVKVALNSAKAAMDTQDAAKFEEAKEELMDILESPEGQESIAMTVALFAGVLDTDDGAEDSEAESGSVLGTIVNVVLNYGILIYLLGFVLVWPIILVIIAIIKLIKALKSIKAPEEASAKLGASLIGALGSVVTIALLLAFMPNMKLGSGMVAILVFGIIGVVVNVVVSRLRAYNPLDFKYANLVQGTGVIKLVGFALFFVNVLKTGFLHSFINSMSNYIETAMGQVDVINKSILVYNMSGGHADTVSMKAGYLIDLALILAAAILALSVCASLVKAVAAQIGLTSVKKASKPGSLGTGIVALITCILPVIASKLENEIFYSVKIDGNGVELIEEVNGSIFSMSAAGESALTGMFVGAALILAADIAFLITKKILCAGITSDEEKLVLSGNAPAYITEAIAEEVVAEEAAEEAPVDETVAEATEEAAEEAADETAAEATEEAVEEEEAK